MCNTDQKEMDLHHQTKTAAKSAVARKVSVVKRKVTYREPQYYSPVGSPFLTRQNPDTPLASPKGRRTVTPPSVLEITADTARHKTEACVSPSKTWEKHYNEVLNGIKFLNIVTADPDHGQSSVCKYQKALVRRVYQQCMRNGQENPSCLLSANLSYYSLENENWVSRWRKLSIDHADKVVDVSICSVRGSTQDIVWTGGGLTEPRGERSSIDDDSSEVAVSKPLIHKQSSVSLSPDPVSPSEYIKTPDEDAYDNVPWQQETYNAMMESERRESAASIDSIPSSPPPPPPDRKTEVAEYEEFVTPAHRHLSSPDSGIGSSSSRGPSLYAAEDGYEDVKLRSYLADFTTANLDKVDSQLEHKSSGKLVKSRPRKTGGIRTKKTRNGALNALKDMGTLNSDPNERYSLGDLLGQGAIGSVYIARDNKTDEVVAIKIVSLQQSQKQMGLIVKEIEALTTLAHRNIINYRASYRLDQTLWIVMDYLEGGSLTNVIGSMELDELCIATITAECVKALAYLHSKRIIHRDIKSDNILMGSMGEVKLTDFGCCAQLHMAQPTRQTTIGTPYWMSPEAIKGKPYNEKADIWSLGMLIIEMIEGKPPYIDYPAQKACEMITKKGAPKVKSTISKDLDNFLKKCLHKKAEKRSTATELLEHPFIVSNALNYTQLQPLMEAVLQEIYTSDSDEETDSYVDVHL